MNEVYARHFPDPCRRAPRSRPQDCRAARRVEIEAWAFDRALNAHARGPRPRPRLTAAGRLRRVRGQAGSGRRSTRDRWARSPPAPRSTRCWWTRDLGRRRRVRVERDAGARPDRRLLHADRGRPVRLRRRSRRRTRERRLRDGRQAASPRSRCSAFPGGAATRRCSREILRGGPDKLREAGVSVLGGHSVRDPELKFGYAVTGVVHPKRVLTNAGARPGDVLVLTKPLGTGILATALKRDLLPGPLLNAHDPSDDDAEPRGRGGDDRIGRARRDRRHRLRPARARPADGGRERHDAPALEPDGSGAAARARSRRARRRVRPAFDRTASRSIPTWCGTSRSPSRFGCALVDPQTSGGLLIAVPTSRAEALMRRLSRARVSATRDGRSAARGGPA